jgi:TatD DNase family protein
MELIDTHAHLYEEVFEKEIDQVVDQCRQAGVAAVLMPNLNSHSIDSLTSLADRHPTLCMPMAGIHPNYIKEDFEKELYVLEGWLQRRSFIAIGEIGLDFYRDKTYKSLQEAAFSIQLSLAQKYQLPVVIHSRAAFNTTLQLLKKHQASSLKGVFHCFSGSLAEAQQIIELGFSLGIGGIITFKTSTLGAIIAEIGLQHLVLETDSPYLAPVPHRGTRNSPHYLPYIASAIAHYQCTTPAAVAAATTANAQKIFNLTTKVIA